MFEGLFRPMHLLVILVIVLIIWGPSKLAGLGKGLGEGIRNFKKSVHEGDDESKPPTINPDPKPDLDKKQL